MRTLHSTPIAGASGGEGGGSATGGDWCRLWGRRWGRRRTPTHQQVSHRGSAAHSRRFPRVGRLAVQRCRGAGQGKGRDSFLGASHYPALPDPSPAARLRSLDGPLPNLFVRFREQKLNHRVFNESVLAYQKTHNSFRSNRVACPSSCHSQIDVTHRRAVLAPYHSRIKLPIARLRIKESLLAH